MFSASPILFTTLATATAGATTTAPLASACTNTNATSICIDSATGDLVQLNGHAMLSGSGTVLQDCALDSSARHPSQIHRLADGGLRVGVGIGIGSICTTQEVLCLQRPRSQEAAPSCTYDILYTRVQSRFEYFFNAMNKKYATPQNI